MIDGTHLSHLLQAGHELKYKGKQWLSPNRRRPTHHYRPCSFLLLYTSVLLEIYRVVSYFDERPPPLFPLPVPLRL